MRIENIERTAVIGAGLMGSQIAEILSRVGGYQVRMTDINDELLSKAFHAIEERLERFFVSKGKLTAEEKKDILGRIEKSKAIEQAVGNIDFAIEAVSENLALKKDIFKKLDSAVPTDAILASNTSYQNISEMAAVTKRPDRVVGMHFFNPVAVMQLVEVIRGAHTSDQTVQVASSLARRLGKEAVVCRDTSYGFLANRAYMMGLMNESIQMVWERVACPGDIDKALKLGYNLPVGPLELGDRIGSWALRASAEEDSLRELGDKGRLHPLIRTMVRAGYTGGTSGKGIYAFWDEVMSKW
jgi:3-hydroxybutyryl-CoA dehydrogenase